MLISEAHIDVKAARSIHIKGNNIDAQVWDLSHTRSCCLIKAILASDRLMQGKMVLTPMLKVSLSETRLARDRGCAIDE